MRLFKIVAIVIAFVALVSVSVVGLLQMGHSFPAYSRVGIMRAGDSDIAILFVACSEETVSRIELVRTDEHFTKSVGVLWAVEADRPASPSEVVVGRAPLDFHVVEALDEPLLPGDHVGLDVTTNRVGVIPIDFVIDELRSDVVLVDGEYVSLTEFKARAQVSC